VPRAHFVSSTERVAVYERLSPRPEDADAAAADGPSIQEGYRKPDYRQAACGVLLGAKALIRGARATIWRKLRPHHSRALRRSAFSMYVLGERRKSFTVNQPQIEKIRPRPACGDFNSLLAD
jgi:hypothetical protein